MFPRFTEQPSTQGSYGVGLLGFMKGRKHGGYMGGSKNWGPLFGSPYKEHGMKRHECSKRGLGWPVLEDENTWLVEPASDISAACNHRGHQ